MLAQEWTHHTDSMVAYDHHDWPTASVEGQPSLPAGQAGLAQDGLQDEHQHKVKTFNAPTAGCAVVHPLQAVL